MARYPAQPLEQKLAWMRERQQKRAEETKQTQLTVVEPPKPPACDRPDRKMLRVEEVVALLGVSDRTVRRWFQHRAVLVPGPHKTIMLISERLLDDWIREHTAKPRRAGSRR